MKTIIFTICLVVLVVSMVSAAPFQQSESNPLRSHQKRNTQVIVNEENGPGGYSRNRGGLGLGGLGGPMGPMGPGFGSGFGPGYGMASNGGGGIVGGIIGGIMAGSQGGAGFGPRFLVSGPIKEE